MNIENIKYNLKRKEIKVSIILIIAGIVFIFLEVYLVAFVLLAISTLINILSYCGLFDKKICGVNKE